MTTKKSRARGRPRRFDPEQAVATAQRLFHTHGYDAVSVADVTDALGINPPSFYSAFGNKAGLYTLVLGRYATTAAIPLDDLLRSDRTVAESLAAVLKDAAHRYAADPCASGCLVLEGLHSDDAIARTAARTAHAAAEDTLRRYIAERHPEQAACLTDFVSTTMAGLSAKARNGHDLDRLLATVGLANLSVAHALEI